MEVSGAHLSAESEPKFKMHWHVVLTHFPVSAFTGAFLFMLLHLITGNPCMVLAAYITLIASVIVLVPTTLTGWFTWKRSYEGFLNKTFRIKIWTSIGMLAVSIVLVSYQTLDPSALTSVHNVGAHVVYLVGLGLLMVAAMVEGFWGGRLHHR